MGQLLLTELEEQLASLTWRASCKFACNFQFPNPSVIGVSTEIWIAIPDPDLIRLSSWEWGSRVGLGWGIGYLSLLSAWFWVGRCFGWLYGWIGHPVGM